MYKLQYGSNANSLYRKINGEWLPIGFWAIGCKNFNSERAYRHLSQTERQDAKPDISKLNFNEMMGFINLKSTV